MELTYKREYLALLQVGKSQIEGTLSNDIETEDAIALQQLRALNEYVYTYYSTNNGDNTYTIEFLFPKEKVGKLLSKLNNTRYWYICITDGKGYSQIKKKLGRTHNNKELKSMMIPRNQLNRYGDEWKVEEAHRGNNGNNVKISRSQPLYFLCDETINQEVQPIDQKIERYLQETRGNVSTSQIDILKDNLFSIIIEDPNPGETSLYTRLLPIVKHVFGPITSKKEISPSQRRVSYLQSLKEKTKIPLRSRSVFLRRTTSNNSPRKHNKSQKYNSK